MRVAATWVFARVLVLLGIVALCGAGYARYRMAAEHLDKSAYYVLGRWLDAVWQVQVPLLAAGMVLLAPGLLLLRGSHPAPLPADGVANGEGGGPVLPAAR